MRLDVDIRRVMADPQRPFSLDLAFRSDSARVVLFGPSGSGKSLTLRAIAGLIRPDAGHIAVRDRTLFDDFRGVDVPARARRIGYVFQDYALFPHLTVAQNVAFGLTAGLRQPARTKVPEAAQRWLDAFELDGLANRYPWQISGGQQQRVALARALAPKPELLLLDEPFAALDPPLRGRLRNELVALQARLDVQMLVITHDPADVDVLGQHVLEIRDGRIHADATRPAS
ncbi:ABC transporter ATP-binding protein [Dyella sp.]|jgi:molybdate transport system ATP-binding protein|uniref:ABC transporter ATP-binding protein n=1 Tax=Dyella sp. TaxID=1869338 RepID=UPI002D79FBCC|nr:ATP-binding cassette domain-containing protein [Dyella sp.]HET6432813.1 ATP-binding cassette domain-containing protein [Dyella sp.]